jgi:hypothetical protein
MNMTKTLRTSAIILLIINGISALAGGGVLVYDPSGGTLQMSLSMLQYSPFRNFLIPGIILFAMNGISSIIICILAMIQHKRYFLLILFQGCILTGWIGIEVFMLRSFHVLHLIFGLIGLILMALGLSLRKSSP